MKTVLFLFAFVFLGNLAIASADTQATTGFDEEVLNGVDRVKDREARPLKISSEADYVANEIHIRQTESNQTEEN